MQRRRAVQWKTYTQTGKHSLTLKVVSWTPKLVQGYDQSECPTEPTCLFVCFLSTTQPFNSACGKWNLTDTYMELSALCGFSTFSHQNHFTNNNFKITKHICKTNPSICKRDVQIHPCLAKKMGDSDRETPRKGEFTGFNWKLSIELYRHFRFNLLNSPYLCSCWW